MEAEFLGVNAKNAIGIGGDKFHTNFTRFFTVNDAPDVYGVGDNVTKSTGFAFDAFDGKLLDGISNGRLFTFRSERVFGLNGLA